MSLSQRLALRDRFRATLANAMEERDQRQEFVDTPDGPELAWVLFERGVMHEDVNKARAEAGLPAVRLEQIFRAEQQAVGHVDYHAKFALYCAEITLDDPRWTEGSCP